MAVHFTHNRLHVGFRIKDYTDVWYEPIGEEDMQGGRALGLYKLTIGEPGYREPMEGEVKWDKYFEVPKGDSSVKAEREHMLKQFLSDAHKYLSEKDPAAIRQMEDDLDQPEWRRWQAWFVHAKKWKKQQMKRRAARKRERTNIASEAGMDDEDIDVNSDTSDSACEIEERVRIRKKNASRMPPPPTPTSDKKRKAANNSSRNGSLAKKQNLRSGSTTSRSERRSNSSSGLFMSGGAGTRSSTSGSLHEDDNQSEDQPWDTRDPNRESLAQNTPPPTDPRKPASNGEADNGDGEGFRDLAFRQMHLGDQDDPDGVHGNHENASVADDAAVIDREERRRQHESEQRDLGINGDEEDIAEVIRRSLQPQEGISQDWQQVNGNEGDDEPKDETDDDEL